MRALWLALLAAAVPAGASAARSKIAVLDIRAVQGVPAGTATVLTAIVVDDAARAGFDVISQADVSAMLGFEKQKKMLGCSEDSSCLAEIGGALGADYVLSGQVGLIGSRHHLSFQLLEARRARVVARAARFSDRDEDALAAETQAAVKELLAAASPQRAPAATAAKATEATAAAKAAEPTTKAADPAKSPAAQPSTAKADLAAKPATPAGASVEKVARPPYRPSKLVAYGTLGAGAFLLLAGVANSARASAAHDALANAWQDPNYASVYDAKSAEVKRYNTAAATCYALGAVGAGLGGWFVWKRHTAPVALAPAAGDGQIGLVAAGSF